MTTWYILEDGVIVNAVETDTRDKAEAAAGRMIGEYKVTAVPTREQLESYRYWRERP